MKKVTVWPLQGIYDLAIQVYGSVEGVTWLLEDNPDLSWDSTLSPGQKLRVRDDQVNKQVTLYYQSKELKPASFSELALAQGDYNIDYNTDFS